MDSMTWCLSSMTERRPVQLPPLRKPGVTPVYSPQPCHLLPHPGGESVTYSSNTNESSLKAGQYLWNTTKGEAVTIVSVNTGSNVLTISPTSQTWNTTDTITNRIYVKDGIFQVVLNSLNADTNWGTADFSQDTIYLGVNFNADGEMKPRSRFTTVP